MSLCKNPKKSKESQQQKKYVDREVRHSFEVNGLLGIGKNQSMQFLTDLQLGDSRDILDQLNIKLEKSVDPKSSINKYDGLNKQYKKLNQTKQYNCFKQPKKEINQKEYISNKVIYQKIIPQSRQNIKQKIYPKYNYVQKEIYSSKRYIPKDNQNPESFLLEKYNTIQQKQQMQQNCFFEAKLPNSQIIDQEIPLLIDFNLFTPNIQVTQGIQAATQIDSRIQITNPRMYPYSAIGYVIANKGFSVHYAGTGCLVGRNLVLTAAHTVRLTKSQIDSSNRYYWDKKEYQKKEAYFYLGINGPIDSAARQLTVKKMYFPSQFQQINEFNDTQSFDYAVLVLDTSEDLRLQFGCFGIAPLWTDITQNVNIFGYPFDRIQKKVQQNKLQRGIKYGFLFGQTELIYEISGDGKMLRYNKISTSEGQSGSPIFIQSKGLYNIVGIHRGREGFDRRSTNIGVKITPKLVENLRRMISRFKPKARQINYNYQYFNSQKYFMNLAKQNQWNDLIEWLLQGKKLSELKILNLGSIRNFKDLRQLNVLTSLQELWLHQNKINQIDDLSIFPKLKKLWLHNNQIQAIKNLSKLTLLEQLWLQNNKITQIKQLNKLTNLKLLFLRNNQITKIQNLDNLTQLRKLYLSNNNIRKIQNLDQLIELQQLILDNNKIEKIENIEHLNNLSILSLWKNQITKIENIEELLSLRKLYLQHNKIQRIQNLDIYSLQELCLGNNRIQEIEGLNRLQSLKKLDLSYNQITDVKNISNISSLQNLNLSNNPIKKGAFYRRLIQQLQQQSINFRI